MKMKNGLTALIGADKSDEWIIQSNDACVALLNDNLDTLTTILANYASMTGHVRLPILVAQHGLEKEFTKTASIFCLIGYMAGRVKQEKEEQIRRLIDD